MVHFECFLFIQRVQIWQRFEVTLCRKVVTKYLRMSSDNTLNVTVAVRTTEDITLCGDVAVSTVASVIGVVTDDPPTKTLIAARGHGAIVADSRDKARAFSRNRPEFISASARTLKAAPTGTAPATRVAPCGLATCGLRTPAA